MRHDRPFRETSNKSYERIVEFFFKGTSRLDFRCGFIAIYLNSQRSTHTKKKKKKNHQNHHQRTTICLSTSSINWIDNKIVDIRNCVKVYYFSQDSFPRRSSFTTTYLVPNTSRELLIQGESCCSIAITWSRGWRFLLNLSFREQNWNIHPNHTFQVRRIEKKREERHANQPSKINESNRSHSKMVDDPTRFEIGEERRIEKGRPRSMRNREDRSHPLLLILTYWLQYLYISIEYSGWGDAFDWRLWGHFDGWMVPLCSTLVSPWLAQGFSRAKKKKEKNKNRKKKKSKRGEKWGKREADG